MAKTEQKNIETKAENSLEKSKLPPQISVRTTPQLFSFQQNVVSATSIKQVILVNDALAFFLGSKDGEIIARRKKVLAAIEKLKQQGQECPFNSAPVMA